ncbi:Uncharacterised protein [Yersinia rohdei]|nr:Uncharacterised protein [Yersinia rohdei]
MDCRHIVIRNIFPAAVANALTAMGDYQNQVSI